MSTEPTPLPPVLDLLRQTPAGDIYLLADRETVAQGFHNCAFPVIEGVTLGSDGEELVAKVGPGAGVTLAIESGELVVASEGLRHLAQTVSVVAILKRLVSPGSLGHVRFSERHLAEVGRMLGHPSPAPPPAASSPFQRYRERLAAQAGRTDAASVPSAAPAGCRLVMYADEEGVRGQVRSGGTPLYPGMPAPRDLARFLLQHYFFRPAEQYFRDFTLLPGGYPIVFRYANGKETPLVWRGEHPALARADFDLTGDRVSIRRSLDGDIALSPKTMVAGECLVDLAERTIRPLRHAEVWRFLDQAREELDSLERRTRGVHLHEETGGVSMAAPFFSAAAIRANLDGLPSFAESCRFTVAGTPADPAVTVTPSFHLAIASDLAGETVRLIPRGEAGGISYPFSGEMFWLLSPAHRSRLSQPLRAKKRVTAMLEGGFALLAAATATARTQTIRTFLAPPDFAKRKIKAEAKENVQGFVEASGRRVLVLLAGRDRWLFAADDRREQARLVELLYRFFGLDPFGGGEEFPAELTVPRSQLLPRLGELAERLQEGGFDLRSGDTPLREGAWEFTIEAAPGGQGGAIDWFELRPEIRCNGEVLGEEELKSLLEGGMLSRGETLLLLGDEQRRILELLFSREGRKGKKKRKWEPVRVPRLQILDWLELRSRGVVLRLPAEVEQLVANLTRLERLPERPLPAGLHATLRPYQTEGYRWLSFLYEHRFGACLADDMGLGKTVQAISLLAGLAEGLLPPAAPEGTPHLIVVPPSLLFNWESELARFAPGLKVVTYAGAKRSPEFGEARIVLTSYGILQRDAEKLAEIPFHVIIFDEAQQVKNLQAATAAAARRLNGRFTLALTGTPLENHLGEYYAIVDLALPGLLGPYDEFRRRIDIRGFGGIDTLIRRTKPFVLRRSKQMIADELPPRIESDLYLELTARQRALYQKTVEEVRGTIAEAFRERAAGQARMIALTAILRLRQLCLCPSLYLPGKAESPKLEALAEQLLELREEGHSALVFSQFTGFLDIVEEGLRKRGLPTLRLDGATPVPQRKGLVRRFQESGEPLVFLISLKAGGKGLNLTRATYVYHLDPWWNPAVENQASDRAHRIGQTRQVTVTRLLMRHTVEEKMMALKERKLKLYQALLEDAAGAGSAALTKEDFDFLLG